MVLPPTEEYAIDPVTTMTAEPPVEAAPRPPARKGRRPKGPEFYKPFHLLLMVYLFFYCSRIPEMVSWLHIGLLFQPILLIGMFMTGTTKAIFKTDIGRIMTAFTVWIAICVPFSTWKGGSFNTLTYTAQALLLLFFMAAFIRTLEDCYRAMLMIALAMAAIGVMSLVIGGGRAHDNRLGLGTGTDTLADANFLALYLVVGLPFLWFSASQKKGFMRWGLLLMMVPVLAGAARTGSRMGLLALAAGLLMFFIFATMAQRAAIIFGGIAFLVLAVTLLPARISERFTTYFSPKSAASVEAANSADARKVMFLRSVQLSLEHPFFGVGPGEFMDAEAKEAAANNKRGLWKYTHNSYTELSSETGFIGLGLFLYAFFRSYRGMTPIRNRYPNLNARRGALFLQIAILMSMVGAFFLSIAYGGILYGMLGISAAFQQAVANDWKGRKLAEQEAVAAAA